VEGRPVGRLMDPGLADQQARRIVVLGDLAPVLEDLVHLRPTPAIDRTLAEAAEERRVPGLRRRVVAQLPGLDETVGHVAADAGDPPVDPEPEDAIELVAALLLRPV